MYGRFGKRSITGGVEGVEVRATVDQRLGDRPLIAVRRGMEGRITPVAVLVFRLNVGARFE